MRQCSPAIWTFPERCTPLFEGATSMHVLEGNRVGGYLQATLKSYEEPISIGVGKVVLNNSENVRLEMRVRFEGSGRLWLEANGVSLRNDRHERHLSHLFNRHWVEMTSKGAQRLKLDVRLDPNEPPEIGSRVIIDWLSISPVTGSANVEELPPVVLHEASQGITMHRAWMHTESGVAFITVRNVSGETLTLHDLEVDGVKESLTSWPLDPDRKAHWAACYPPRLEPDHLGEVRISLRVPSPPRPRRVTLGLRSTGGGKSESLGVTFSGIQEALEFQDAVMIPAKGIARLFVKGGIDGDRVIQVFSEGVDITAECDLSMGAFNRSLGIIEWHSLCLPAIGSRNLFEVITERGAYAIRSLRLFQNDFPLGIYGAATPEAFADYSHHAITHYLAFRNLEPRQLDELAAAGLKGAHQPAGSGVFKEGSFLPLDAGRLETRVAGGRDHSALAFYSLPDEPDVWDFRAGEHGSHGRSMAALSQMHERLDPSRPIFVQLDNTYRSDNYRVYAPMVDVAASHTYLLGQHFLNEDRVAMMELMQCVAPGRLFWVTQFYPLKAEQGEHVAYSGRLPTVDEMHLQLLSALGGGAKGIFHYMHSASQGGRGGAGYDRVLWDGLPPLHRQILAVGGYAAAASRVSWEYEVSPQIGIDLLTAGKEALVVVVINKQFRSTPERFDLTPHGKGEIRIKVPSWIQFTCGNEIMLNGMESPLRWSLSDGWLSLQHQEISCGAIYLFK